MLELDVHTYIPVTGADLQYVPAYPQHTAVPVGPLGQFLKIAEKKGLKVF